MKTFQSELTKLINAHCLENESDSPDYILAEYILDSLDAYNSAVQKREAWHGRKLSCVDPVVASPADSEFDD